ncbi:MULTISPECIES: enoyl-CoA hydratase/isomerase family protein [unclassified Pseudofrankia]|uniref:enoyl-CoA hydratase/isomerase family protein n=1 Tax=unclassified Pseudofrankia TaxID=2994372 RepID=UPI0008D8D816|nr:MULTISPECIES: enoyl-CoA hydratase/isomerase family protein [unclassified Pseudofrankia]MDT3445645.1 enoyl-CoA hydratase/isomerase family protein [Pseudofrankia sp. BMG5.37]OHV63512.1 enoyl-CoA hydratase [Pseudofrankia sp. BMG5.36]
MPIVEYDCDARGVATITLNDPSTRNSLSNQLLDELIGLLEQVKADDSVRVVVLRSGDEQVFSSGGDLKAFSDDVPMINKYAGLDRFPRVFRLLGQLGRPSICAAGGDVLAGAFGLALACDLIVARTGVRFGCPEINVGVFPFMISALIYRSVPRAKANELMMTGQLISAEEAERLHLVNTVAPPDRFAAEVDEWAGLIASRSPLLMRMGKNALDATRDQPLDAALGYLQAQLALAFATEDLQEGVAAFRARRQPRWSGR